MRKALIILALLASPVYAKDSHTNSRGDFIPPDKPHDWYMDPQGGKGFWSDALGFIILNFGDRNDYQSPITPPKYEQERLRREQLQTGQIYAKPDPVICQWEPEPNAVVCHR